MTELKPCHDCGAAPGEQHQPGCDTEVCYLCGGQAIQCYSQHRCPTDGTIFTTSECVTGEDGWPGVVNDEDRLPWTGEWPGVAECREFGWYANVVGYRAPTEDLTRLHTEAKWSRELKRFVLRTDPTP